MTDNPDKNAAIMYAIGCGAAALIVVVFLFMLLFANAVGYRSWPESTPTPAASPSATP
jgi:hypothetical protein